MGEPPSVDDERNPAETQHDDHDLDRSQSRTECDDGQRSLGEDQRQQSSEQREEPQGRPDSKRNPAEAAVAGRKWADPGNTSVIARKVRPLRCLIRSLRSTQV